MKHRRQLLCGRRSKRIGTATYVSVQKNEDNCIIDIGVDSLGVESRVTSVVARKNLVLSVGDKQCLSYTARACSQRRLE